MLKWRAGRFDGEATWVWAAKKKSRVAAAPMNAEKRSGRNDHIDALARQWNTGLVAISSTGLKESEMGVKQLLVLSAAILAMGGSASFAQATKEPYVRVAEIEIDPAQLEAYKTAVKEQAEAALRLEPGVLALYSVADKENPAHVTVFEIYTDAAAYQKHLETAHFKNYKTTTQDIVKSLKLRETVPILLAVKRK